MKNKIAIGLLSVIGLFMLGLVASAFGPSSETKMRDDQGNELTVNAFGPSAGAYYHVNFPLDTINDAEVDYKTLPNFLSNFQICTTLEAPAAVSGTRSLKLVLEENNDVSAAFWRPIDSLTLTTGYGLLTLRKSVAECPRYRIRVNGSGSEVAPYTVRLTAKKLD